MFALADINSFYASCEKVFRPDLRNEPVIVLSNNDGCVIARSPEAKALGIRMGQPWFQVRQMRLEKKIHVFSSNYALYHSMSQRVMAVLESLSPAVEPYSIDEMFIDLRGINHCISPEIFGHQLREQVKSWTGCQRQDYWPFFAIFNVRYWSLMLSAFRHFIITDWRGVFCQHSRFAFFL